MSKLIKKWRKNMSRMKTFFKYAMWVILFFIFSEIMININLETVYRNIGRKDNLPQVTIYQAQATKVNGRIKGIIKNQAENKIESKYIKVDFYSERDVLLGTKYIDVSAMRENETQDLELYFKLQNVDYYEMSFTNEKTESEITLLPQDLTTSQIRWLVFLTFLLIY